MSKFPLHQKLLAFKFFYGRIPLMGKLNFCGKKKTIYVKVMYLISRAEKKMIQRAFRFIIFGW